LRLDNSYRTYFKAAFGDETINADRMTTALTQFVLTMVSSNSQYDKVMRGEATFTLPEQTGYEIFKVKCASCHTEPLFTDNMFRNTGIPVDPFANDLGRFMVTSSSGDILKFKVPSLRNSQRTFPYGHDGRFFFLDNVLEHYRSGVVKDPATDPIVRNGISLSNYEIGQLKAFLYSLTDTGFLNNRHFSEF
jgi:cytochrome c peroxidase